MQALDFHPKIGLVSRTMARAADDLLHFIFLFVILFTIFICTMFLLLGPTFQEFSDLEKTTQSLFELLLGEVGLWAEVIDIKGYFSIHNFMLVNFVGVMFFCLLCVTAHLHILGLEGVKRRLMQNPNLMQQYLSHWMAGSQAEPL